MGSKAELEKGYQMTVSTNGAEIKKFFSLENNDFWKNGIWCEDDEIVVDGHTMTDENCIDDIEDSAVVTLSGGQVFFGVGIEKENGPSVEAYFKVWRKNVRCSV